MCIVCLLPIVMLAVILNGVGDGLLSQTIDDFNLLKIHHDSTRCAARDVAHAVCLHGDLNVGHLGEER